MLSLILFQLLFVATVYNGYIIVRTRSLFSIPPISIKNFAPPRFRDKAKSNEIGICIDIEMKPAALFHRPEMFFFKLRAGSNAATQRFDQDAHQLNTQRLVSWSAYTKWSHSTAHIPLNFCHWTCEKLTNQKNKCTIAAFLEIFWVSWTVSQLILLSWSMSVLPLGNLDWQTENHRLVISSFDTIL